MFLLGNKLLFRDFSIAKFAFLFSLIMGCLGTVFYAYFQSVYIALFAHFLSFFVTENIALQLKGGVIDIASFNVPGKSRKKLYFDYLFYRIGYMGIIILMTMVQLIIHLKLHFPLYIYPLAYAIYLIVTMPLVVSIKRNKLSGHIIVFFVLLFYITLNFQTPLGKDIIQSNIQTSNDIILIFHIVLLFLSFFSFKWFCHILDKNPFVSLEIKKKHERWN